MFLLGCLHGSLPPFLLDSAQTFSDHFSHLSDYLSKLLCFIFFLLYPRLCDILHIFCVFVNNLVPLMEHTKLHGDSSCVCLLLHGIPFHHPDAYLARSSCWRTIISSVLNSGALLCGFNSAFSAPELATQCLSGVRFKVRVCQHDRPKEKLRGLAAEIPKCLPWKKLSLPTRQRHKQGQIESFYIELIF